MKRLLLRPRAASDIDEHIERIAEDNPEAALAVLEHLEAALKRIGEQPGVGSPRYAETPRLAGLRMWPEPAYRNYLIFYMERAEAVEVVRILYGTRDMESVLEEESTRRAGELTAGHSFQLVAALLRAPGP